MTFFGLALILIAYPIVYHSGASCPPPRKQEDVGDDYDVFVAPWTEDDEASIKISNWLLWFGVLLAASGAVCVLVGAA